MHTVVSYSVHKKQELFKIHIRIFCGWSTPLKISQHQLVTSPSYNILSTSLQNHMFLGLRLVATEHNMFYIGNTNCCGPKYEVSGKCMKAPCPNQGSGAPKIVFLRVSNL